MNLEKLVGKTLAKIEHNGDELHLYFNEGGYLYVSGAGLDVHPMVRLTGEDQWSLEI